MNQYLFVLRNGQKLIGKGKEITEAWLGLGFYWSDFYREVKYYKPITINIS